MCMRVKATERLGELFGTVQRLLPLNKMKKENISNHIVLQFVCVNVTALHRIACESQIEGGRTLWHSSQAPAAHS